MPLGLPVAVGIPITMEPVSSWLDTGSNWVRLLDLTDARTQVRRADATVTCRVEAKDGTPALGPITLSAIVGKPGSYEAVVNDSRFRVDSAVVLTITANTPDGAQGIFARTLRVVRV